MSGIFPSYPQRQHLADHLSIAQNGLNAAAHALEHAMLGLNSNALAGQKIGFLGDSITNRSTATPSLLSYVDQTLEMLGTANVRAFGDGSVLSGHPGATSATIAPFLQSDIIAAGCNILVTLQGTNDTGQGVALATYAANMIAQFKAARAAGMQLFVMTIPPRGSNSSPTATQLKAIEVFNAWLRLVVPFYGTLVDIHAQLVNNSNGTNYYIASYDSGDGIHPGNLGHRVIALALTKAMSAAGVTPRSSIISDQSALSLVTNGCFLSNLTGWYQQNLSGTAPAVNLVADTTGILKVGQWQEIDFAPGASSGFVTRGTSLGALGTNYAIGDVLAVTAKVQIADVTGDWTSIGQGGAGTAVLKVGIADNGGAFLSGVPIMTTGMGVPGGTNIYNYGLSFMKFTVPSNVNSPLVLWVYLGLPANHEVKLRIGEIAVINLTQTGLLNLI